MGTQPPFPKRGRSPFLLWPNGWMHQDATWYGCGPQPMGLCVKWRPSPLPKIGAESPQFSVHVYCSQTAGWMNMVLGMEVGLSPENFVLDGDPVHFPQKGADPNPQFSAHFYCSQMARCIKMSLCMDVGLSPGDFVLNGDPVFPPQQRGEPPPNFRPISIVPKRLDASRYHSVWR